MDAWDIVKTLLKPIGWLFQGNQLIILVFVVIGMVLVGVFTDSGPKKWLGMLVILLTGGLLAKWLQNRGNAQRVKERRDFIALIDGLKADDQVVREGMIEVQQLQDELTALKGKDIITLQKIEEKRIKIRELEEESDRIEIENEPKIAAAERVLARMEQEPSPSERIAHLRARMADSPEINAYGTVEPLLDPRPIEAADIHINGFAMKGDIQ